MEGLVCPTDDQWDRLAELSPSEIAKEAELVAETAKLDEAGEAYEINYGEEGGAGRLWGPR